MVFPMVFTILICHYWCPVMLGGIRTLGYFGTKKKCGLSPRLKPSNFNAWYRLNAPNLGLQSWLWCGKNQYSKSITWVKQCHKPPIWEWFMPPIKMAIWGMVYDIVLPANQAIPNRGLWHRLSPWEIIGYLTIYHKIIINPLFKPSK